MQASLSAMSGLPERVGRIEDVAAWLDRVFPRRAIRRVLLVNPPDADASVFRPDTARRRRYPNYPPYGLAVVARSLRAVGVDVRICNLNHEVLKQCCLAPTESAFDFEATWSMALDRDIVEFEPNLVGVTCMFTMTHASLKRVCHRVKSHGLPLAIGGVHVSNDVMRILDDVPGADMAFLGEGEIAMQRFVEVANGDRPVEQLGQLAIADGPRRHHFPSDCRPDGDQILVPAYDLLDLPEYSTFGTIGAFYCFKPKGTRFATVLSNRGCRARCTFCSVRNFNGPGVRQRSVASVVDEMEVLKNEYGVEHVMWLDDDLLRDHARAIALFNEIVRRNLGITWDATNGLIAASCTEEVMAAAAESGCIAVNIGMESGNPRILREIKKPGRVENFLRAAEVLRKFEQIHSSVLLMLGFPGETMSMILDTINVAREMDLDWHRISALQPLPNTPIYDSMVAQGLIQPVGSTEVRFNGGAYGKQVEIEQGRQMATANFEEAFTSIRLDQVPTGSQIVDVWFYMNYHLNFHRLFTETRPEKIRQQLLHLRTLCDVIAPENGFALYFLGYLQHKVHGRIESEITERLGRRLATSPYWLDRFGAFGLSLRDLETADFPNSELPRLVPGQLPRD